MEEPGKAGGTRWELVPRGGKPPKALFFCKNTVPLAPCEGRKLSENDLDRLANAIRLERAFFFRAPSLVIDARLRRFLSPVDSPPVVWASIRGAFPLRGPAAYSERDRDDPSVSEVRTRCPGAGIGPDPCSKTGTELRPSRAGARYTFFSNPTLRSSV